MIQNDRYKWSFTVLQFYSDCVKWFGTELFDSSYRFYLLARNILHLFYRVWEKCCFMSNDDTALIINKFTYIRSILGIVAQTLRWDGTISWNMMPPVELEWLPELCCSSSQDDVCSVRTPTMTPLIALILFQAEWSLFHPPRNLLIAHHGSIVFVTFLKLVIKYVSTLHTDATKYLFITYDKPITHAGDSH